jgi:hypothetical protein
MRTVHEHYGVRRKYHIYFFVNKLRTPNRYERMEYQIFKWNQIESPPSRTTDREDIICLPLACFSLDHQLSLRIWK